MQGGSDAGLRVGQLIECARAAQGVYERFAQEQVDEAVTALGWTVVDPRNNRLLCEMAVADTGLGRVEDKMVKNRRKTMGLLRDLQGVRTVGVLAEHPESGVVEIARPVGVVGAVVPSTNPVATPLNMVINALKGRNAIILSPSPKGQRVCAKLLELLHAALERIGAPRDLVQQLSQPVDKQTTWELMQQVDLVVVTGSSANVRAAYSSGTPAIGVGTGNVPVIVDASADLDDAAEKIARSKTFDNATSCSSENSVVILDAVYAPMLEALRRCGGALLDAEEKAQLQRTMWRAGRLSPAVIAKSVAEICEAAGLDRPELRGAGFLLVEEQGAGAEFPYSGEKLSPVLTLYRAADFDAAFACTRAILEYQGKGHSVGIHTRDDAQILRLGLEMPTCRVIVNQAHAFATGGSFDNGLPFSLSMGCGTWGRNSISDNLHYRHYLNITRIARSIEPREPTELELFGAYLKKYGLS
jgi:sulfoacetaldehyde dehydrogenase